jgi:hypothetical protein
MRVTILYEDRRGDRKEFGLHDFVCQCVVDRCNLHESLDEVRNNLLGCVPVKGSGNLRKRCQQDLKRLADRNMRVFAVFDEDQVSRLVNLQGTPCRPLVCKCLATDCHPADKLEIVLIRKNIETVMATIRDSNLTTIPAQTFEAAIGKKQRPMRDRVFSHCARKLSSDSREKLLTLIPDIARLVSRVVACLDAEVSQG